MDHEIELAPKPFDLAKGGIDRRRIGNVAMADDMGVELFGKRPDALLERFTLIGEGELGAGAMRRLGYAPGDRTVIGRPKDEAAAPGQDSGNGGMCRQTFRLGHSRSWP